MTNQMDAQTGRKQASGRAIAGGADLEATRKAWNAIAPGFDEFVTPTNDWALPMEALRRAGLQKGMRFLDVASGSGALSIPAARLGARVTAVDIAPAMIERLEARARADRLADVEGRVMDGHALELDDDTFDVAGSQFGVMLFPDLPRALREMVRVTRPGGRVFLTAFGAPERVGFLTVFFAAMERVVPGFQGLPKDPPPLPFQVADPEKLRRALADAGLREIHIERSDERLVFADGQAMWNWVTSSNPLALNMIAGLTPAQRDAVVRELDGLLRERSGGELPAVVTAGVHIAIGTKG